MRMNPDGVQSKALLAAVINLSLVLLGRAGCICIASIAYYAIATCAVAY